MGGGTTQQAKVVREMFREELSRTVGEPRLPLRQADTETLGALHDCLSGGDFAERYECDPVLLSGLEGELAVRDGTDASPESERTAATNG